MNANIAESLKPLAVELEKILPDPANARTHNDKNLRAIAASLKRYGQRKPVVVNKSTGICEAGNGTLDAARSLGWSHVAVVYVEDDPVTASGYALADNRAGELAEWDYEALADTLRSLEQAETGVSLSLGWDAHELEPLLAADWKPADIEDLAGDTTANGCTVEFTGPQWQAITTALPDADAAKITAALSGQTKTPASEPAGVGETA